MIDYCSKGCSNGLKFEKRSENSKNDYPVTGTLANYDYPVSGRLANYDYPVSGTPANYDYAVSGTPVICDYPVLCCEDADGGLIKNDQFDQYTFSIFPPFIIFGITNYWIFSYRISCFIII